MATSGAADVVSVYVKLQKDYLSARMLVWKVLFLQLHLVKRVQKLYISLLNTNVLAIRMKATNMYVVANYSLQRELEIKSRKFINKLFQTFNVSMFVCLLDQQTILRLAI